MSTRDWRRVLVDAAEAAGAREAGAAAVASLAAFGNGAADQAAASSASLQTVLAALDSKTRTKHAHWAPGTIVAARAGLRIVPRMIRDLDAGLDASVIAEHLDSLSSAAAAPPDDGSPTAAGWRCPRCGSRRIDEQHTDGTGFGRYIDVMCEACGLTDGFDAGAPDESTWRE
jgi:predicted nucleic-acid-binding Zn-ribbon protein